MPERSGAMEKSTTPGDQIAEIIHETVRAVRTAESVGSLGKRIKNAPSDRYADYEY